MKNVITSIAAFLLVIWYSLSVIGFDVHTCSSSGETYIATVISGTACEDIHPEHTEKPCSCCHGHDSCHKGEDQTMTTKPCCNDEWQMIVLTGVRATNERTELNEKIELISVCVPELIADKVGSDVIPIGRRTIPKPDSGNVIPLNFQQVYSIWRI